jgi:hypothetical protein
VVPQRRRELTGELHVAGDGTFTVFDETSKTFTRARELDRVRAVPTAIADSWRWTIVLDDAAETEDVELDASRWAALFDRSDQRGERPSVHNSWCPECPSVGVSHGVCC